MAAAPAQGLAPPEANFASTGAGATTGKLRQHRGWRDHRQTAPALRLARPQANCAGTGAGATRLAPNRRGFVTKLLLGCPLALVACGSSVPPSTDGGNTRCVIARQP